MKRNGTKIRRYPRLVRLKWVGRWKWWCKGGCPDDISVELLGCLGGFDSDIQQDLWKWKDARGIEEKLARYQFLRTRATCSVVTTTEKQSWQAMHTMKVGERIVEARLRTEEIIYEQLNSFMPKKKMII